MLLARHSLTRRAPRSGNSEATPPATSQHPTLARAARQSEYVMIKRNGRWYFDEKDREQQREYRALMQQSMEAVIEAAREMERRERERLQNRLPVNDDSPTRSV
jgi:hypothetical protein